MPFRLSPADRAVLLARQRGTVQESRPHQPRQSLETDTQREIIRALTLLGYTVLSTSERRKRHHCPGCGEWSTSIAGTGTTPGVPDLLVTHLRRSVWVHGDLRCWLGLEVKGPKTRVRPEQAALADVGAVVIVRTVNDALEAIQKVEGGGMSLPNRNLVCGRQEPSGTMKDEKLTLDSTSK